MACRPTGNPWAYLCGGFLRLILLGFVLAMTSSCSEGHQQSAELGPRHEAIAWLEANPNPYAFAGNRFASTREAMAFVEMLYEYGALEVLVTGIYDEEWRLEAEGGPYADTLIVRLPADRQQRVALIGIASDEAEHEGFSPERDTGQEEILMWWD